MAGAIGMTGKGPADKTHAVFFIVISYYTYQDAHLRDSVCNLQFARGVQVNVGTALVDRKWVQLGGCATQ